MKNRITLRERLILGGNHPCLDQVYVIRHYLAVLEIWMLDTRCCEMLLSAVKHEVRLRGMQVTL